MKSRRQEIEDRFDSKTKGKLDAGRALDHDGADLEDYQSAMIKRSN